MRVKCAGTRRDGEPCGAWAIGHPEKFGDEKARLCAGHAGLGVATYDEERERRRRAGKERRNEAARRAAEESKKTILERMADVLRARADEVIAPYMAAIEGGDWRAAEALITRVHGKPVERVEQVGADADALTAAQRQAMRERLLEEHPALRDHPAVKAAEGLKAVSPVCSPASEAA